jgi:hypothetical protein
MVKQRSGDLSVSSLATIYGCCGLFDLCGDEDLISLTMQGSSLFMDWLGWEAETNCIIEKDFINWSAPDEGSRQGWVSDPCADGNKVEFGTCAFRYEDFGRLRRGTPVQDITKDHLKLCERQPRYRLDGSPINSDMEFRALLAAEEVSRDLHSLSIIGNNTTAGQFHGLENLVRTGYTDYTGKRCSSMDSILVDWNSQTLSGGAGTTWTDGRGTRALGAAYNLIDVLHDVFRVVKQRVKMSPPLAAQWQNRRVGDFIILATDEMVECILDAYTCWRVCPGEQFEENNLDSLEARSFRDNLLGGMFGDGRIFLNGFEIPLLAYDWELQKGPTTSDIYLLTGSIGNVKTLMGQHNDFGAVPAKSDKFLASDGGRFLHWEEDDHTCIEQWLELQPRIISWAPWTNVRIQNVVCRQPGGHISPDPLDTSFFPETSFVVATC